MANSDLLLRRVFKDRYLEFLQAPDGSDHRLILFGRLKGMLSAASCLGRLERQASVVIMHRLDMKMFPEQCKPMTKTCGWCDVVMFRGDPNLVSHGICPACLKQERAKFEAQTMETANAI